MFLTRINHCIITSHRAELSYRSAYLPFFHGSCKMLCWYFQALTTVLQPLVLWALTRLVLYTRIPSVPAFGGSYVTNLFPHYHKKNLVLLRKLINKTKQRFLAMMLSKSNQSVKASLQKPALTPFCVSSDSKFRQHQRWSSRPRLWSSQQSCLGFSQQSYYSTQEAEKEPEEEPLHNIITDSESVQGAVKDAEGVFTGTLID